MIAGVIIGFALCLICIGLIVLMLCVFVRCEHTDLRHGIQCRDCGEIVLPKKEKK